MSDAKLYPVPAEVAAAAWIDDAKYQEMYKQSVDDLSLIHISCAPPPALTRGCRAAWAKASRIGPCATS